MLPACLQRSIIARLPGMILAPPPEYVLPGLLFSPAPVFCPSINLGLSSCSFCSFFGCFSYCALHVCTRLPCLFLLSLPFILLRFLLLLFRLLFFFFFLTYFFPPSCSLPHLAFSLYISAFLPLRFCCFILFYLFVSFIPSIFVFFRVCLNTFLSFFFFSLLVFTSSPSFTFYSFFLFSFIYLVLVHLRFFYNFLLLWFCFLSRECFSY